MRCCANIVALDIQYFDYKENFAKSGLVYIVYLLHETGEEVAHTLGPVGHFSGEISLLEVQQIHT